MIIANNLSNMRTAQTPENERKNRMPEWLRLIEESIDSLEYGVVQIVVHNAKVVQIEKTEKLRLDPNS
jgi:hypothetical protein